MSVPRTRRQSDPDATTEPERRPPLVRTAPDRQDGTEALVVAVANLLVSGRALVKGMGLRALQEHCYEFLLRTEFSFPEDKR